eukprot:SM000183S03989  [mRNA]  locus=s183:255601:259599:+ [translate_table: standard]
MHGRLSLLVVDLKTTGLELIAENPAAQRRAAADMKGCAEPVQRPAGCKVAQRSRATLLLCIALSLPQMLHSLLRYGRARMADGIHRRSAMLVAVYTALLLLVTSLKGADATTGATVTGEVVCDSCSSGLDLTWASETKAQWRSMHPPVNGAMVTITCDLGTGGTKIIKQPTDASGVFLLQNAPSAGQYSDFQSCVVILTGACPTESQSCSTRSTCSDGDVGQIILNSTGGTWLLPGKTYQPNPHGRHDFTWVQAVAILYGEHKLYVGAQQEAIWDNRKDHLVFILDGKPLLDVTGTKSEAVYDSEDAGVQIRRPGSANLGSVEVQGLLKLTLEVKPIPKRNWTETSCFAHIDMAMDFAQLSNQAEGVLGQTYQKLWHPPNVREETARSGMKAYILQDVESYQTSSLLEQDCPVSIFEGRKYDRAGRGSTAWQKAVVDDKDEPDDDGSASHCSNDRGGGGLNTDRGHVVFVKNQPKSLQRVCDVVAHPQPHPNH